MTLDYPIAEGEYEQGKWTWIFSVCSMFHNIGIIETEIALRAFRYHMRGRDVKLHILHADPKNEKMRALIKSVEPDLYLEQSHNFGKMGNLDILVRTVKTQFMAIAHCDTIMLDDEVLSWPRAVFDTHPEVCFIYPPGHHGGFSHGWYELNVCLSFLCCLRTEVWHKSGISFGKERNIVHPGKSLPLYKDVGGYIETPRINTEAIGHAFFELIKRFGVEAVMLWPQGFTVERVSSKPVEVLREAKAVHLALTHWSKQEFRTGKESSGFMEERGLIIKRRKIMIGLLKKYRELTPNIPIIDYEISDSAGVI